VFRKGGKKKHQKAKETKKTEGLKRHPSNIGFNQSKSQGRSMGRGGGGKETRTWKFGACPLKKLKKSKKRERNAGACEKDI